jgi:ATP sulfurylase
MDIKVKLKDIDKIIEILDVDKIFYYDKKTNHSKEFDFDEQLFISPNRLKNTALNNWMIASSIEFKSSSKSISFDTSQIIYIESVYK